MSDPSPRMIGLIVNTLFIVLSMPFIYYADELVEAVRSFF